MLNVVLVFLVSGHCLAEDVRPVSLRFLGGARKAALNDLTVTVFRSRGDYSLDKQKPTATSTTDDSGTALFELPPARYYVEISARREVPYLPLPIDYKGHPWLYDRTMTVTPDGKAEFEFRLADACRLTLKAVDAETGKGIAGVEFVTENATAELWGIAITGDQLGAKGQSSANQVTDSSGVFRQWLGPRPGFTYFPWSRPKNYELVGPAEVELSTGVGTPSAEHVFRFRRVSPKAMP